MEVKIDWIIILVPLFLSFLFAALEVFIKAWKDAKRLTSIKRVVSKIVFIGKKVKIYSSSSSSSE